MINRAPECVQSSTMGHLKKGRQEVGGETLLPLRAAERGVNKTKVAIRQIFGKNRQGVNGLE